MRAGDEVELGRYLDSAVDRPTLGLVYGRRRIGKSTMLVKCANVRRGFYYEATRVETSLQLERLGRALGEHLDVGRVALADWEEAIRTLVQLGAEREVPIVLDEFGHIIEADRSVDSILASEFGPGAQDRATGRARLVLCGSAITMMRALTAGEAPLRGRAGMELVMQSDDFRTAATRLPDSCDLETAVRVFAVIGGVVGYATDMVNFDLPTARNDFDRWVVQRVLSSAATLHREATTLFAEDPSLSGSGSLLHHSILGAIANGSITVGAIANRVGKQVSNITPALGRLIDAGLVVRHEDPVRSQRPRYAIDDSYLQFHYAVLDPHGPALRDRDPAMVWATRLRDTFGSRVRGPVFEEQARTWIRRFADDATLAVRDHIGSSSVVIDGIQRELDIVTTGSGEVPSERAISSIGEAKAGEEITLAHLHRLERARLAFGRQAAEAKLMFFATSFESALVAESKSRADLDLVDLERLYFGS